MLSSQPGFYENVMIESRVTITGLSRAGSGLAPRKWQLNAKPDVQIILSPLLGREVPVVFNPYRALNYASCLSVACIIKIRRRKLLCKRRWVPYYDSTPVSYLRLQCRNPVF